MVELKVGLLGGGSWGTTVASLIARNAQVMLWARDANTVDEINREHTNRRYLPDARLPREVKATADIEEAVSGVDVLVMGIPSHNFRQVLEAAKPYVRPWVPVISLTKGLELATGSRMSEVVNDVLPEHPAGVLTGPNLAREIMAGQAAASVISIPDPIIIRALQKLFHSGVFRVYTNEDLVGCELGGVLKNIIAVACGMGDGLGVGDNTRSALITRGLAEVTRLGTALGGAPATFAGLAGLGDLIATCTSPQSRNRSVGVELGKGRSIDEIINEMFMVAEGVKSAPAVMELARKHNVHVPIAEQVFEVVQSRKTARQAFVGLLRREATSEDQPG